MKILILGPAKWDHFCRCVGFDHEVAIFDTDPKRLRFTYNTLRMIDPKEIEIFAQK